MGFFKSKVFVFLCVAATLFIFGVFFVYGYGKDYQKDFMLSPVVQVDNPKTLPKKPLDTPSEVKAIYLTGWSAGSKNYVDNYLNDILKTTRINTVVIDIKDVTGLVSYKSSLEKVNDYRAYQIKIKDVEGLIDSLHKRDIYVIGRIVVFKDSALAKERPDLAVFDKLKTKDISKPVLWQDKNGMYWLDTASKEVQDYNVSIAKEALGKGFDEINFDYIRFPSDGKTENIGYPFWDQKTPRHLVIKDFFERIRQELGGSKISVDLFGQGAVSSNDLGIGQIIEDSFDYFDYVCPMVYPSHFADGFLGYKNPADHPYEVIKYSMDSAMLKRTAYEKLQTGPVRLAEIRPWLQDFNLGAYYTKDMVLQEIKAVKDSLGNDYNGFLLWNPSNFYTKEALIAPDTLLQK